MSHSGMVIPERSRDIGDFLVGRLLPFRRKRMIGPFIFIDHMGPTRLGPEKYMDIGQHPHIGLSTLTYLFEGEVEHRDGLGTRQRIRPGSVNWMTAGRGITHTERTPEDLRRGNSFILHGYQIWVALPKAKESMAPEFFHADASELPKWQQADCAYTLVAGSAFGHTSPVPVHSELFLLEVKAGKPATLEFGGELKGEIGIILVDGVLGACQQEIEKGSILYSKPGDPCRLSVKAGTHLLVFGGVPFPEERWIDWNFVASSRETIQVVKEAWKAGEFPMMEDEESYVPLPGN
jgi:redox-sensitive bicupin YhaK (pirin superfamily)